MTKRIVDVSPLAEDLLRKIEFTDVLLDIAKADPKQYEVLIRHYLGMREAYNNVLYWLDELPTITLMEGEG